MTTRDKVKLWGGVVVGVAGLVVLLRDGEVVWGSILMLAGFGIAPIDRVLDLFLARITGQREP